MGGHIKVSVIMLTYNHEKYIRQALDSVLSQRTTFPYEVLVGDDASADRTASAISAFQQDGRLHVYTRQSNMGGSANLAALLRCAKGEYIASCEGDDYWTDPQKLQKQIDFLEKYPEYIGCTHEITLVDKNGVPHQKQSLPWIRNKPVFVLSDFRGIYLPGHPVSMVYRNIFADDPSAVNLVQSVHRHIADRTIAMLLASKGKIARLEDDMACYRQVLEKGGGNLTASAFVSDPYGKLTDLKITNRLEAYLRKEKGLHIHFNGFRARLLLRTFAKAICFGSADSLDCCRKMLREWRAFRQEMKEKEDRS